MAYGQQLERFFASMSHGTPNGDLPLSPERAPAAMSSLDGVDDYSRQAGQSFLGAASGNLCLVKVDPSAYERAILVMERY